MLGRKLLPHPVGVNNFVSFVLLALLQKGRIRQVVFERQCKGILVYNINQIISQIYLYPWMYLTSFDEREVASFFHFSLIMCLIFVKVA